MSTPSAPDQPPQPPDWQPHPSPPAGPPQQAWPGNPQNTGATPHYATGYTPQPPRRPRTGKILLAVIGGVLALCLCGGIVAVLASGDDEDTSTAAGDMATSAAAQPDAAVAAGGKTSKAAEKKWVTVAELTGTGNKRGATFHLGGVQTRLTYTVKGGQFATAVIYVLEKGTSLEKDGGFPEVTADGGAKDTTELVKDKGDYYLDVKAANATWTVTVQEYR